jgi:glycosyltransferase involved in cell wall biosynthesis
VSRILIVGINYWPEVSGIGPYTTAMAEHLAGVGHDVTVFTGMPHYPAWTVARGFRGRLRRSERRGGVRIERRAHYVPPRQSALRRALYEGTFLASALDACLRPRHDAIVGVVPSLSGAVLARIVAARSGTPYAVLFQDLMGPAATQSGIPGGRGRVAALTGALEGWVARGATRVGVVSAAFVAYLREAGVNPERIVFVPNWARVPPPSGNPEATRRRLGWRTGEMIALHAGNMGLKQGLEQVVETARLATERAPQLRFVLVGDGSQREHLQREARGLANVAFLPFQPESEFPDLLAAADVLLLSERPTVADMSLPSKLTSYFLSGRPVVAAVAPGGATAELIRAAGGGVVVAAGRPEGILHAIEDLRARPAAASRLGSAGRMYATRELSAERSLGALERMVSELSATHDSRDGWRGP